MHRSAAVPAVQVSHLLPVSLQIRYRAPAGRIIPGYMTKVRLPAVVSPGSAMSVVRLTVVAVPVVPDDFRTGWLGTALHEPDVLS